MSNFLNRTFRLSAIAFLPVGLLIAGIPNQPAVANEFNGCLNGLLKSDVSQDKAGIACAEALVPEDLSDCVFTIKHKTSIVGDDALKACLQVRRPLDLANCVVDINNRVLPPVRKSEEPKKMESTSNQESPLMIALDSCRRSLLPERYSECVIALNSKIEKAMPVKAMATCLSAEDFPRDVFNTANP